MSQTIKLKRGTTTPTTSDLVSGEVAIDTSAKKLYINDAGTIKEIGGGLGTISVSDVPNLPASKITSGTFATARIPSLDAAKITSGTFGAARIPNLNASKITAGTIAVARLPTIPYSQLSGTPTIPTSLPANGGNSDTVDNLHASSFTRADADLVTTGRYNTMYSGAGTGQLSVGRGSTQALHLYVDDNICKITADQDSDSNGTHTFVLNREFDGTGANNFSIQKAGNNQFALDTNANATFYGNLYVPEYIRHSGDTNTYIRLENDQISIVAGGTTKFHSGNTYLTTNSTLNASNIGSGTIPEARLPTQSKYLRSDTADSYSSTITATGSNWYLWSLGARGASSGQYGIGNRSSDSYRQLTFHVPNQAAYSSSGTVPSFGWYSNGADQLMKLDSASGNLWIKGYAQAGLYYDKDNTAYRVDPAGVQRQDQIHANWVGIGTPNQTSGSYKLNMGGSIDMNNNSIHYASEVHFQDGPRFMDGDGSEGIILKSNSGSVSKLALQTSNGSDRGYLYANSSNEIGLLDSGHSWAIKHQNDSNTEFRIANSVKAYLNNDQFYHTSSLRAPIFYDKNNTNYYIHGDNESRLNKTTVKDYKQWAHGEPRNNLGAPTVTEMALFDEQFNNKTLNHATSKVTFWRQQTSSSSWTEYTAVSDAEKKQLLRGESTSNLSIPNLDYKFRIEIDADGYTYANALYMYWSSQSHSTQVHIYKRRCSDNAWIQHTSATNTVSSWPGHLYLPFSTIPWHETNTTSTGHFNRIRIEFTPNWSGHADYGDRVILLYKMQIWGGYPAGRRTPYYYDENLQYFFPQNIQAYRYYDRDNTSKYLDPAGTSELSHLNVANNITAGGTVTISGTTTLSNRIYSTGGSTSQGVIETDDTNQWWIKLQNYDLGIYWDTTNNHIDIRNTYGDLKYNNNKVWHAGNDGSSSGLDADLLDGQHGSHYLNYNNLTNKPTIPTSLPANGGNADTVDGQHASDFMSDTGMADGADTYMNFRVMRNSNSTGHRDGMYIGYGNSNSGVTRLYGGGATNNGLQVHSAHTTIYGNTRSPLYYDSDNTGYYLSPNNDSRVARLLVGDGSNYIRIGDEGEGANTSYARIRTNSSGDLFLDQKDGRNIYLSWYTGTSARIYSEAPSQFPLHYDRNNTAYYSDPNGTSSFNAVGLAGRLTLADSGYSIGNELHVWKRNYVVNNTSPQDLLYHDGNALPNGGAYRVQAHIAGTGTDQSATAVFWNQNGTWKVNVAYQSGTSSNHPEFIVGSNGKPQIHIDHTSNYTISILHERLELSEGTGTDNKSGFGADGYMSEVSGVLRHNPNGGSNHTAGNRVFTDGYHPNADALTTSRTIAGSSFDGTANIDINYNNLTNKPTIPDTSNLVTTNTAQTISGAKTFTANVGVSGNISANFYAFNGSYVNASADARAPIYYDRNNTAFYVHADSESVLGNVRANDFRLSSGNGKGVRFWNSNSYKIYMSSTGDSSWGGRAPYESTSDYNMYFRMNGGTNRGFVFRNNTTNVAGIDASGNFNTSGIIKTGNGAASAPAYSFTADYDSGMFSIGSNAVGFATGGTQRFKINSNGLLLTGTSSLWVNGQQTITNTRDIANVVNYQNTDGHMQLHRTGAAPLIVNRKGTTGSSGTSRGEIVNFKSADTKIGRIGYAQPYGGLLYFATGNTSGYGVGVYHFSTSSDLRPVTNTGANNDNAMDLGATSARYDDVYATNGTIQTSDRNEKQDIQELTDAETRAAVTCKGLMRRFRWIDSVAEKGDDARYHFGAIAQDVEAAFTAEGLDASDYGLFIRSTWWEHEGHSYPSAGEAPQGAVEKTRLGIRYNQLFAFIIGAL